MAAAEAAESNQIKVHPLSTKPDKCYEEEESSGRFKSLQTTDANTLFDAEKKSNTIRFVCISDTHNKTDRLHDKIPDGDVLLHAGDFTATCAENEIVHFNDFLGKIKDKFKHIVVIAGNHELSFDESTWNKGGMKIALFKSYFGRNPLSQQLGPEHAKALLTNCTYIEDEAIELYGIKIYGSPWQPVHHDLAFNGNRGEDLLKIWDKVPNDTDILITHGPPLGVGDLISGGYHVGCTELLSTVLDRVKPKYHIFGHIHEDYGIWSDGTTRFINAATCDKKYRCVHRPIVFDYPITESTENL